MKKYRIELDRKGISLSKKYERGLPETIVPDGPLNYVLDCVFQYGIRTVTPGVKVELSTKSSRLEKDLSFPQCVFRKDDRFVEIELLLKGESSVENPIFREESWSLMLLRLAQEVVRKNQGAMKLDKDEKQGRLSISLWFPSERREIVYYHRFGPLVN